MDTLFKYVIHDYLDSDDKKNILEVSSLDDFDISELLCVDIRYEGDYALVHAVRNGNISVVSYLSDKVDILTKNKALSIASSCGNLDLVRYFINNGCNVSYNDDYIIRCASELGHLHIVKYLVENGANIHSIDGYSLRGQAITDILRS